MKKLLFSAYTLDIGGIETALVNLLNNLIEKYNITLVLEKKQGIFLNELDNRINVIEYAPCQSKNVLFRKFINMIKRIKFILKYKNKFDFAASFATYSKMGSFCARTASKNNALWGHLNYLKQFNDSEKEMVNFFNFIHCEKFKHIIFVSQKSANSFIHCFPSQKSKVLVCNNLINYNRILELSNSNISMQKDSIPTFLNVGRHEEHQKKLTRIIEAAKILSEENYQFKILFVGDGPDNTLYKELVNKYNLDKNIVFCGKTNNPYPYFKISDAVILSSDYEGYPVVFVEAMTLGLPILTTDVSDSKSEIEGKFGMIMPFEAQGIAESIKDFIENKDNFNCKFDPEEFNKIVLDTLEKIF